jgi:hypothetical protein
LKVSVVGISLPISDLNRVLFAISVTSCTLRSSSDE